MEQKERQKLVDIQYFVVGCRVVAVRRYSNGRHRHFSLGHLVNNSKRQIGDIFNILKKAIECLQENRTVELTLVQRINSSTVLKMKPTAKLGSNLSALIQQSLSVWRDLSNSSKGMWLLTETGDCCVVCGSR